MEESLMFDNGRLSEVFNGRNEESIIVYSGTLFALYRLAIDGKYFLFKTTVRDDNISKRLLRREYEMSTGCDHPNIVNIVLYGSIAEGREGILMEYIDGRTLSDFLAEKPSVETKKRIYRELLDAVNYLHKKGVVHNDLKPENIMITRNGDNLKLIDFGLSDNDAHFLIKTPGCTFSYAAPELKEQRCSDSRSDIYSLGLIAITIFGDKYRSITAKCTQRLPDKRYRDVSELKKAFDRRDSRFKIVIGSLLALLLLSSAVFALNEIIESRRYVDNVEHSLSEQKDVIQNQNKKYLKLQNEYSSLKENYSSVNSKFEKLKDSLAAETRREQAQQQIVENYVDKFRKEFSAKTQEVISRVKSTGNAARANEELPGLMKRLSDYYDSYPKSVKGEDVESRIKNVYLDIMEQLGKRLRHEIEAFGQPTR